jgi:proline iminopeptidase
MAIGGWDLYKERPFTAADMSAMSPAGLYPELSPYRTHRFKVSPVHEIYVEEAGNPRGKPAVFVHGGPGGGLKPEYRRLFDPAAYRIVLFDQRGCGQSTPRSCLEANTTWDLVADMERLREHLHIEKWLVFGGSWGSTLALAYAQAHPERVSALVLRGIFLLRDREIRWFYQDGAGALFPEAWEEYLAPIPPEERGDMVSAYYRQLTGSDAAARRRAAKAWSGWEARTSKLLVTEDFVQKYTEDEFADAFARIECHYFVHRGFFRRDDQLLADVHRLAGIPGAIVQGRYDVVCPMMSAWALHKAWPESELHVIPDAGHSAFEPGILDRLVEVTDRFADRVGAPRG